MNAAEIKQCIEQRGLKIAELAERLGVGYEYLRKVITGKLPLTVSIESRLGLILNAPRVSVVVFAVSPAEGIVTANLHAPEKLTDTERQQVMLAIRNKVDEELAKLSPAQD